MSESLEVGKIAPFTNEFISSFLFQIEEDLKTVSQSPSLIQTERDLALTIQPCLKAFSALEPTFDQVVSASMIVGTRLSPPSDHSTLPPPDANMVYTAPINSIPLVERLVKEISGNMRGMKALKDTGLWYYPSAKTSQTTSSQVVFVCPEVPGYCPLKVGQDLVAQRLMLHTVSQDVAAQVKKHMLDTKERNAQIVFSGVNSGAAVAQMAAIRLMYDPDLMLYRNRHRVISVSFGDVRVFSPEFIMVIDKDGFDHKNHIAFCSIEAFLPMNVAARSSLGGADQVNWIGRRLEYNLATVKDRCKVKAGSMDSKEALTKYMGWGIHQELALETHRTIEEADKEPKGCQIGEALEALQDHIRTYRLRELREYIMVNCVEDVAGRNGDSIPSTRIKCTVLDTRTKASLDLFFHTYWVEDVHDITAAFSNRLLEERLGEYKYDLRESTTGSGPDRRLMNSWILFFRAQLSGSPTAEENLSRLVNPFTDESILFGLKNRFHYSMRLSSEVTMKHLLSTSANDQLLTKVLFGPSDFKAGYNKLDTAGVLFHAPLADPATVSPYLHEVVKTLLTQPAGPTPTIADLISIKLNDTTGIGKKTWGDYEITQIGSFNKAHFTSTAKLADILATLEKDTAYDCSSALPARQCPRVSLLGIPSVFWKRVYLHGDVYISYRGSSTFSNRVRTDIDQFCTNMLGRDHKLAGAGVVFELVSKNSFGASRLTPQYTFYMMIMQNPGASK